MIEIVTNLDSSRFTKSYFKTIKQEEKINPTKRMLNGVELVSYLSPNKKVKIQLEHIKNTIEIIRIVQKRYLCEIEENLPISFLLNPYNFAINGRNALFGNCANTSIRFIAIT
jgi:16S rRNA C1402 N4-methylase RsmH